MNQWTCTGRLGQPPRLKTLPSGDAVLNLSVAVHGRREKDKDTGEWRDTTIWVDVSHFGKNCQWLSERLDKGALVVATGEMNVRTYTGRDGTEKTQVELFASRIEPLDRRENGAAAGAPQGQRASAPPPQNRPAGQQNYGGYGSGNERGYAQGPDYADDIPF